MAHFRDVGDAVPYDGARLIAESVWLPLTRELLSVSETEGEKSESRFFIILSLRLLLRKIHLPEGELAAGQERPVWTVTREALVWCSP